MIGKLIELLEEHLKVVVDLTNGPYPTVKVNYGECAAELIANNVVVREKGEWDDSGRYQFTDGAKAIRCSNCGCALTEMEYQKYFWNFCPVCGADMRGEEHAD